MGWSYLSFIGCCRLVKRREWGFLRVKHFAIVQSDSTLRPMLRLALPALAEESLVLMVTWTDWWLAGHYFHQDGDPTKAAMALMGYAMWLIPGFFAAVAIGVTALVARMVGAGDYETADRAANQGLLIGAILAAMLTAVLFVGGDTFIWAMQLRGRAAEYAHEYLYIVVFAIPLIMCGQVGAAALRGAGDTVTGFVAKLVVVTVNILVSTSLVAGVFGFEPIGWKGLAIGTAVGHALGGFIILVVLLKGRAGLHWSPGKWMPNFMLIRRILRIGIPGGADVVALAFSQLAFVAIINSLGDSAAAAHGLAVQIEACCYLPGAAFQVAAATMAGQFLGAGLPTRATRGVLACVMAGGAIMVASGMVLYFFGDHLAWFFTGDWSDPTTLQTYELLRIVALVIPFLAIAMIINGGLRGAGDTVWPLLITLSGFLLVRIPLAAWFSLESLNLGPLGQWDGCAMGVAGAWYAMAADILFRSLLVLARFFHGGWRNIPV